MKIVIDYAYLTFSDVLILGTIVVFLFHMINIFNTYSMKFSFFIGVSPY